MVELIRPDGTREARTTRYDKNWRDSRGRTRLERLAIAPNTDADPVAGIWPTVEIIDPVAGFWYVLDRDKKIAHRGPLAGPPASPPPDPRPPGSEDLGTSTINGVVAQGWRITSTPPSLPGGAASRSVTRENWTSAELQLTVLAKNNGSQNGDTRTELLNLNRAEPDASLFSPGDYRVVDETGPFTITWGTPPPPSPQLQPNPPGVSRIGNGVSAPRPIYQPQPSYTEQARQARIEGSVLLSLVVGEDGKAHNIRVTKSLDPSLDQMAIEAVEQWEFQPGQKEGKPVPVLASIEVNFRLLHPPPAQ